MYVQYFALVLAGPPLLLLCTGEKNTGVSQVVLSACCLALVQPKSCFVDISAGNTECRHGTSYLIFDLGGS